MRCWGWALALALACGSSGAASACADPISPTFDQAFRSSTRIVAVRVESARIESRPGNDRRRREYVVAEGRVVGSLKGERGEHLSFEWSTYCQGRNLRIGGYYAIVTAQPGDTVDLTFEADSLVEMRFGDEDGTTGEFAAIEWSVLRDAVASGRIPAGFPEEPCTASRETCRAEELARIRAERASATPAR